MRKHRYDGEVSYVIEVLPGFEISDNPRLRCTSDDTRRKATSFFLNVYGASESINIPVPPNVPEDLGLLKINYQRNWDLDELVAPASGNDQFRW